MIGFWSVFIRESQHYFVTPIAYVVISTFWLLSGFFFSFNQLFVSAIDMVSAFHNMSLLLMLMIPLLTMRSFAEEKQAGTLELLMTLPISDGAIILAKYLSLMMLVFFMLLGSSVAVMVLIYFGEPDLGPILGGYTGIFLLASSFSALGLLISSLSANQVVAATTTWSLLLVLWFIDYASALFPASDLINLFQHISFSVQYLDIIRGVVTGGGFIYFFGLVLFCLVSATQVLRMKRF
jgi:ABC-2 type transport system permease protein